jgi:threonine/homoserine/homoserine lactone efflux protein
MSIGSTQTMFNLPPLVLVAFLWALAAISPGPNFLLTVQMSLTRPRDVCFRAVAGISLGTFMWGAAGFLGVRSLFVAVPWVYVTLKVVGGMYLAWLGAKLLWKSRETRSNINSVVTGLHEASEWESFKLGFFTNLSNPKTAVFVAGLFAATMPRGTSASDGLLAVSIMTIISFSWYSLVALFFTNKAISGFYSRGRCWIDRFVGVCFVFVGVLLAVSRS